MSSQLFYTPIQAVLYHGLPAAGAKVAFYLPGTTTKTSVYVSSDLTTAHTNPVVADGAGQLPAIYLDSTKTYRVVITDADDNAITQVDPYTPGMIVGLGGQKGDKGDPGTSTLLNGTTDPSSGTGVDGDFYINTTSWKIFGPKAAGTWPAGVAIIAAAAPTPVSLALLGVGDSITAGAFATTNFFNLAATQLGASAVNRGYWGNSWAYDWPGTGDGSPPASHTGTLIDDVASDSAALLAISATSRKIVAFAGRNGIVAAGHSAATEYANFETWLAAMVSTGISASDIYVATALPATDLNETIRTDYNTALINGAVTHGYKLIRFDQNSIMGVAGAASNTTYYSDGVHPTDAGHALLKVDVVNAILGVVSVGPFAPTNQLNTTVTDLGSGVFKIEKTGGSATWGDAAASDSVDALTGDFIIRYTPKQTDKNIFAGLSSAPTANNSYTDINGYNIAAGGVIDGGYAYTANQNWFLKRSGSTLVRGYGGTDGVTGFVQTASASGITATFYVKVALYDLNGIIEVKRLL